MNLPLIERTKTDIARFTAHITMARNKREAQADLDNAKAALAALTKVQPARPPEPALPAHLQPVVFELDYPSLVDQPAYNEAADLVRRFSAELEAVTKRLHHLHAQRAKSADEFAELDPLSLLNGGALSAPLSREIEILESKAKLLELNLTRFRQKQVLVEEALSADAVRHVTTIHKARVQAVRVALDALHEANRAERSIGTALSRKGYDSNGLPFGAFAPEEVDPYDRNGSKAYYFLDGLATYTKK